MLTETGREYAAAGVDYRKLQGFKNKISEAAKSIRHLPNARGVFIEEDVPHAHGGIYEYRAQHPFNPHKWCQTVEGLGNKDWIAAWMQRFGGDRNLALELWRNAAYCNVMMAVNDNIANGAMPVAYSDEIAAGRDDWFMDEERANHFIEGLIEGCKDAGCALVGGETPALKYLVNAAPPLEPGDVPSLSGCSTGIIVPMSRLVTGKKLCAGDVIVGITSSGLHANGVSLVIKKAMDLPEKFLTKVPRTGGKTLGEEAMTPTRCYVKLVEALLNEQVEIHALLPGTGDGVAKLAFDKRPFKYTVHSWPKVPPFFLFMRELGISIEGCLTTFNWGVGYYVFVPRYESSNVISIASNSGFEAMEIGRVEEGERKTVFGPEGDLVLPPPGE